MAEDDDSDGEDVTPSWRGEYGKFSTIGTQLSEKQRS